MDRRDFMRLMGLGVAAGTVAPSILLVEQELELVEPEPVRRYWQVGANVASNVFASPILLSYNQGYVYEPSLAYALIGRES